MLESIVSVLPSDWFSYCLGGPGFSKCTVSLSTFLIGSPPSGVILEAPFNNVWEGAVKHPVTVVGVDFISLGLKYDFIWQCSSQV